MTNADIPKPTPEAVLAGLLQRVEAVQPPTPGNEWHMATGALLAFGTVDALDNDRLRYWEARVQSEAQRLGLGEPPLGS